MPAALEGTLNAYAKSSNNQTAHIVRGCRNGILLLILFITDTGRALALGVVLSIS